MNTELNTSLPYNIPNNAVPYILYQRTAYLRFTHSLLYRGLRRISPISLYKPTVHLESLLRGTAIKAAYMSDMEKEYSIIRPYLPEDCASVLDIGCGIAGINIFLNRHYEDRNIDFYLLDKSKIEDDVFYLFNQKGAFYNSLELARDVLKDNKITPDHIHLVEANDKNEIRVEEQIDLIISLISWGFHYPVSVYLDRAHDILSYRGCMIIDVRKETDGLTLLKDKFCSVEIIEETQTRNRVVCKKS